jgi:hypothetical protein
MCNLVLKIINEMKKQEKIWVITILVIKKTENFNKTANRAILFGGHQEGQGTETMMQAA